MNEKKPRAITLEWLLDVLTRRGLMTGETRRDIEVQAAAQAARLQKDKSQIFSGLTENKNITLGYHVSATELLASFELLTPQTQRTLDDDLLARLVAEEWAVPYHKIDPLRLDMDLITSTLSRPFALRHVVLPVAKDHDTLVVAVENPFDLELLENLRRITRGNVRAVVSSKLDILKAIVDVYGFRKSVDSAAKEARPDVLPNFEQLVRLRSLGEIEANDQHIVNAVDFLLHYAFDQRASDIHIEPRRTESHVRLRIDGVLHNVRVLPRRVHPAITSRIKSIARMDIAEKRRPQDGRIRTHVGDREVELRVSTLPTAFGEKTVVRVFDPGSLLQDLPDLGFDDDSLAVFHRWIEQPNGMILITGPTGSGKTTTLYTTLKTLADDSVNVTSVEDPIEMVTEAFNQVAVQPQIGMDFSQTLRSILRQDPDVIMVGEIRDAATAEMAVQSALTGHLVLSTLHTNDAIGAFTRLLDLGIPRFLVTSTLVGVMAQRLVRRVCKNCAGKSPLTADQQAALGILPNDREQFAHAVAGQGCSTCRQTGFRGRVGIFELFDVRKTWIKVEEKEKPTESMLRTAAIKAGMQSMREHALKKLAEGLTTAEEVIRVVGPLGNLN